MQNSTQAEPQSSLDAMIAQAARALIRACLQAEIAKAARAALASQQTPQEPERLAPVVARLPVQPQPEPEPTPEQRPDVQADARAKAKAEADARMAAEREYAEELHAKCPAWARAVIVAEYTRDESEPMTDYFGTSTQRRVLLAWSKHTRDLFPEMRKAAATFEQTRDLGPGCDRWRAHLIWDHDSTDTEARERAYLQTQDTYWKGHLVMCRMGEDRPNESPVFLTEAELTAWFAEHAAPAGMEYETKRESVERREKYSMGHGYYLSQRSGLRSGWDVCKIPLTYSTDKTARPTVDDFRRLHPAENQIPEG